MSAQRRPSPLWIPTPPGMVRIWPKPEPAKKPERMRARGFGGGAAGRFGAVGRGPRGRGGVASPTGAVTDPPALDTRFIDWRDSLGTDTDAVTDGGKAIDLNRGTEGYFESIANPGGDWPVELDHVAQISMRPLIGVSIGRYAAGGGAFFSTLPEIGQTQELRFLLQNVAPDGVNWGGYDHGIQTNIGTIQLALGIHPGSSGTARMRWGTLVGGEVEYTGPLMDKSVLWLVRLVRTRMSTTVVRTRPYYYDVTTFDADNLDAYDHGPEDFERTSGQSLLNNDLPYNSAQDAFQSLIVGSSGQNPPGTFTGIGVLVSAVAASIYGFPGMYPAAEEAA